MTADDDRKSSGPRRSAKGKQKAEEKFARQAEALRANLRRRQQQRRGQKDESDSSADSGGDGE